METRSILTSLTHILFFLLFPYITFAGNLQAINPRSPKYCPSFPCGILGIIGYPFTNVPTSNKCGQFINCKQVQPQITLEGRTYVVKNITYSSRTIVLHDQLLQTQLDSQNCNLFSYSFALPLPPPYVDFRRKTPFLTLYRCLPPQNPYELHIYKKCSKNYELHYGYPNQTPELNKFRFNHCSVINLPLIEAPTREDVWGDPFALVTAELTFEWNEFCHNCNLDGGQCLPNNQRYRCYKMMTSTGVGSPDLSKPKLPKGGQKFFKTLKFKIGSGVGVAIAAILAFLCCKNTSNKDEVKEDEASMVAKT